MNIQKSSVRREFKVHVPDESSVPIRPACGGGRGARSAEWQLTMAAVNCERCRKIMCLGATASPGNNERKNEDDKIN